MILLFYMWIYPGPEWDMNESMTANVGWEKIVFGP